MRRNVTPCSSWQLYVIIDRTAVGGRALAEVAASAIRGGADVIQLRDKTASARQLLEETARVLPLTRAAGIPLIINDRADVARSLGADGVHLGQDDLPVNDARDILGPDRLIGKSIHNLEQALAAEREGADYIGVGPIFPTPTKPDTRSVGPALINAVSSAVHLPIVCIGGIDGTTLESVLEAGAKCVAVVRAVCGVNDPEQATRVLKERLGQFVRATP